MDNENEATVIELFVEFLSLIRQLMQKRRKRRRFERRLRLTGARPSKNCQSLIYKAALPKENRFIKKHSRVSRHAIHKRSQIQRGARRRILLEETAQSTSESTAASHQASSKRKLTTLEADQLKTNKKIRNVLSIFEKYMKEKFKISVESSGSE